MLHFLLDHKGEIGFHFVEKVMHSLLGMRPKVSLYNYTICEVDYYVVRENGPLGNNSVSPD